MTVSRRDCVKSAIVGGAVLALPTRLVFAGDVQRVRYGGSGWLGHYPVWLSIKAGYFQEEGVEVGWETFGSLSARLSALVSGNIDVALTGSPSAIALMARGSRHFCVIGTPDNFGRVEGLFVRETIKNLADLKGKKIGATFASSGHLLVLNLLEQAGLKPDKDVSVLNIPASELPAAVQSKQIDAASAWTPQFNAILAMPDMKLLADDTAFSLYKEYGLTPGPDVLLANREFLNKSPETAKRFLKAYFRAGEQLKTQPQSTVAALSELTKLSDAEQLEMVKSADWYGADEQRALLSVGSKYIDGLERLASMMVRYGQIDRAPRVRDWIEPAFS